MPLGRRVVGVSADIIHSSTCNAGRLGSSPKLPGLSSKVPPAIRVDLTSPIWGIEHGRNICQSHYFEVSDRNGEMPLTHIQFPILPYFLCVVESRTGMPAQPLSATSAEQQQQEDGVPKPLPKGMVLGPDGKP